jgi:hypothetical protein
MKILILTFLTVLQSYSPTVLQSYSPTVLQFYREDIVFKITETTATTDAIYHFCNVGKEEIRTPLFYPFPENTMELIDSLVIFNSNTNEIMSQRKGKSGVFFDILVPSYGQASYRVFFRQKLTDHHFKYILTSTESWGRALEFANFELQTPEYINIDSLSYPPDTSFIKNDLQYFFWKKKDFMPELDFEIFF